MCAKRYKLALPSSSQRIRKARVTFRKMSKLDRIDLMVKAGALTEEQAQKVRGKVVELEG